MEVSLVRGSTTLLLKQLSQDQLDVFLLRFRKYQNVIQINEEEFVQHILKHN